MPWEKNKRYWKNRFEELEKKSYNISSETIQEIEPAFDASLREIQDEIERWYARLARNNEISITDAHKLLSAGELKEFKWTVEEYIKFAEESELSGAWIKQLENASAKFHISRLESLRIKVQHQIERAFGNEKRIVSSMISNVYGDRYYRTAFELSKGFGIGFDIASIDERKLDIFKSKPWAPDGRNFSDRIWRNKTEMQNTLHNELVKTTLLGLSAGEAIETLAAFVDKKFRTAKTQAARLVRTEQAFFASAAQKKAFEELDVEEFEIVATLDSRTSEICRDMDGKHFPLSEFVPGVTAPPFHVFCRSTTCPYFNDEFTVGEKRAARDEDGNLYYVPADMSYGEWEKEFVKKPNNFDNFDITEKGTYEKLNFKKDKNLYFDHIKKDYYSQKMSAQDLKQIWDKDDGYVRSLGYSDINSFMRGSKSSLEKTDRKRTIDALDRLTTQNKMNQNYIGFRKVDMAYVKGVLGVDTDGLLKNSKRRDGFNRRRDQEVPKDKHSALRLMEAINAKVGTPGAVLNDQGFTSISLDESLNYFSHYPVKFEIQVPKGTKGLITKNLDESEFILKKESSLEILGSKVYNDGKDECILVYAKVLQ